MKQQKAWLHDRLKLEVSEEKSKIVNLKKGYSEFLGFKLTLMKKVRPMLSNHISVIRQKGEKRTS